MKFKFVSLTIAASGLGALVGVEWEKYRSLRLLSKENHTSTSEPGITHGLFNLFLPQKAFAAELATVPVPNITSADKVVGKYGYPSLDNLRLYDSFILSYDRRNRVPLWVFEHITKQHVKYSDDINRANAQFQEDSLVHSYFRATNSDYNRSGYDRGHLAAAANHRWSQKAMDQTFFLTNIAPQVFQFTYFIVFPIIQLKYNKHYFKNI